MAMTASMLTLQQANALTGDLTSGASVLDAWTFTATGYTTGNPVYLSFNIGPNLTASELAVWHYDGTTWTHCSASDLSYDGTYANFTVTGFSGYAVTTAVPEPASLALLGLATFAVLPRRKHPMSR